MCCRVQGTLSKFPAHLPDPYTDAHVEFTPDGLYKGNRRRPFVTYKNITRSAKQGKTLQE
jgi:hypothetical protein